MFMGCIALQELPDISKWNTKNVTLMIGMFAYCMNLKSLPNIRNWDTSSLQDYSAMFFGCVSTKIPDKFKTFERSYDHIRNDVFHLDDDF